MKKSICLLLLVLALVLLGATRGRYDLGPGSLESWKTLGTPYQYVSAESIQSGIVEACDDETDFTAYGGTTLSNDTTNTFCTADQSNIRSVKATGGGTYDGLGIDWGGGVQDLRNKVMIIRLYLHEDTGISAPDEYTEFQVFLSPAAGANYDGSSRRIQILTEENLVSDTKDGWYEFAIPCNTFDEPWDPFDMIAVRSVHVWGLHASGKTPAFTLDRFMFVDEPSAAGIYAIRIDPAATGTWPYVQPVAAYAASQGVKMTFGCAPWLVGTGTYFTVDNLRTLTLMGHELAIYSGSQAVRPAWQDKTQADKIQVCELAHRFFADNGFAKHSAEILFQSGGGGWTNYDEKVLKAKYLAVNSGTGTTTHSIYDPTRLDWSLFINNEGPGAPAALAGLITAAEADNTILVLGAHIDSANERTSLMNSIDDLVASTLVCKTFVQIYQGQ